MPGYRGAKLADFRCPQCGGPLKGPVQKPRGMSWDQWRQAQDQLGENSPQLYELAAQYKAAHTS